MNQLDVYRPQNSGVHEGYTKILAGPEHPNQGRFYPGPGLSMSYDDLKTIEAYQFLKSIVDDTPAHQL